MTQNRVCNSLKEHMGVFQKLIHDCLHRRAIFESIEESIKDPKIFKENTFVSFYQIDYLRSQLADLRKFFDRDDRVYQFSFIKNHLNNKKLKGRHSDLYKTWKNNFEDSSNKISFHHEKGYAPKLLKIKDFNQFLNDMNDYFNEIHRNLSASGYELVSNSFLSQDLLKDAHRENFKFFLMSTKD